MRRSLWYLIGLIVIIAIVLGLYFGFHKSKNNSPTYSSTGSNSSTRSNNNPNQPANGNIILTKTSSTLGDYLTDGAGKPLYTYANDTAGVSNCTGSCLTSWPPYTATKTTNLPSGVTTIKRSDNGTMQYAYNGLPLYYFTGDSGSTPTGNGVSNFTLAKPTSQAGASTNNSSNSSSNGSSNNPNPY